MPTGGVAIGRRVPYKACLQMASYSGGHKQAQYDYQVCRELQGKARLQTKSYRTTNENNESR